jgi:hypothetical protein
MEKKRIILPSKKFFGSTNEDLNVRVGLDETRNLLREGDRTIILNNALLFDKERNESNNYKIHGKIKMVFRNMYSGTSQYNPLLQQLYLVEDGTIVPPGASSPFVGYIPYNEFAFLRKDVIREVTNVTTTSNINSGYTPSFSISGLSSHQNISSIDAPYHNWNLYLTYVYSADTQYPMKYTLSGGTTGSTFNFVAGDGIPFRIVSNGNTYKLTSPVPHGISNGEYIVLTDNYQGGVLNPSSPITGRTFSIVSVGDEIYNSENYVLEISKSELPTGLTISNVVFGKRCINKSNITGTTSTYYVHKHKTLTEKKDYILDKIGFESPIWENERKLLLENSAGANDFLVERNKMESLVYDFKTPLVLTGLTNNLGYLPTEVYLTTIFRNGNGYFQYPPKVGWKFNFHNNWIDNHFSGNTSVETTIPTTTFNRTDGATPYQFTGGTDLPLGTVLNGAYVEYNKSELNERIISPAFHRISNPLNVFNYGQSGSTVGFSGASINNMFGLTYQPHNKITLRELSPYIETSTTDQIYGLPQNAKYFEDEKLWRWRDLYDHGFIDPDGFGTNFPFINNIHYVKNEINFYLRNENLYNNKQDLIKNVTKFDC